MINPTLYSSASVEWETPQDLFDRLNARYQFTLDVCATPQNAKCSRYLTREQDGLAHDWDGERVWCNPPYGRGIGQWVQKCSRAGLPRPPMVCPALAVMLVPARVDTAWWHNIIWNQNICAPYHGVTVDFIRGRLKFGGSKNSAPFPSAIVVFGVP